MDIQSALYSGVQGFQRASAGVAEATREINRRAQTGPTQQQPNLQTTEQRPSLTNSLVRLGQEERNAQANAKTMQTADDMLGTVIDIRV
jgi:hypothetical protein